MKALKIILYVILGLVVIVLGLSFIAPTKMHVERSVVIKAPKEVIFRNVKMFANIRKWSPWEDKDSAIKTSIEGTDGTVGASYKWVGNKDVGEGEQTIKKIDENKSFETDLHFIKPWESHAAAYTNLNDTTDGVKVSWGFNSEMSRPFNVMGLFMNMDKTIGGEYEKGLARLKALSETEAMAGGSDKVYTINEVTIEPRTYIGKRSVVTFDKLTGFFGENFPNMFKSLGSTGAKPASAPSGLYFSYDEQGKKTDVAAAVAVSGLKGKPAGIQTFDIKGGKALEIDYYGDYWKVGAAHTQLQKAVANKKYKMAGPVIEEYITDPMSEKDTAKWLTKIYYLVE